MQNCPLTEKCSLFQGKYNMDPSQLESCRNKYCEDDYANCLRYRWKKLMEIKQPYQGFKNRGFS